MTVLLEFRERLKLIYSKYEVFLLPLAKLFLAFVTFTDRKSTRLNSSH